MPGLVNATRTLTMVFWCCLEKHISWFAPWTGTVTISTVMARRKTTFVPMDIGRVGERIMASQIHRALVIHILIQAPEGEGKYRVLWGHRAEGMEESDTLQPLTQYTGNCYLNQVLHLNKIKKTRIRICDSNNTSKRSFKIKDSSTQSQEHTVTHMETREIGNTIHVKVLVQHARNTF